MRLEELNSHERDSRISFDEEPHIYYVDGIPYDISVTGFIKEFTHEFNEDEVINKYYNKWQSNKNHKYYNLSMKQIKNLWKKNREEASSLGSILHKDIELFYNGIDIINHSKEFALFLNFFNKTKKYVAYRTEWQVFDEEYQLAGSIDMCFIDKNDEIMIIDWKRSKEIRKETDFSRKMKNPISHIEDTNYWHYALQLNLYKYILEKNYGKYISFMYVVKLHPNQIDFESFHIPDLTSELECLLNERTLILKK